ncbi:hypothetical protein XELAEV_18018619mg [Xenopus laevis]|uniref:Uncharacterized protein n=1 Tax=Xenopus laevis TaxID=8355 RepID=A0A974HTR1_XENLA|nr:hypothetical protein XELAEV_18018619mg [Xenopus laevis]
MSVMPKLSLGYTIPLYKHRKSYKSKSFSKNAIKYKKYTTLGTNSSENIILKTLHFSRVCHKNCGVWCKKSLCVYYFRIMM